MGVCSPWRRNRYACLITAGFLAITLSAISYYNVHVYGEGYLHKSTRELSDGGKTNAREQQRANDHFVHLQQQRLPDYQLELADQNGGTSRQEDISTQQRSSEITEPHSIENNENQRSIPTSDSNSHQMVAPDDNRNINYTKYIGEGKFNKKDVQFLIGLGVVEPESLTVPKSHKVILWYIPKRYHPKLAGLHPLRFCPEKRCRITTNRFFYNQSDALIFAAQILNKRPPAKLQNQIWILNNHESPHWITANLPLYQKEWRSKFNWTLDYRVDADIKNPYAVFRKKNGVFIQRSPVKKDYKAILERKYTGSNATVAWMVSVCNTKSRRFDYVREMQKHIKVDIFGGCGHKCARSSDAECFELLSRHYKFYLSFENNFCKDYITEKFIHYYDADMLMVVRGGGNYSQMAPDGTYINAGEFSSPKELAEYLNNLNRDDKRFLDMLKEKDKYQPETEIWPIVSNGRVTYMTYHWDAEPLCELCDRMWNQDRYRKHYEDIREWFSKGKCTPREDIHIPVE